MILPKRLQPGDTIAIVGPSSPVNQVDLEAGIALFKARGYQVQVAPHVMDRVGDAGLGYLAGSDANRAQDLNNCFASDAIDAIICARGGYGAIRLMDRLDWAAISARPKIFVGYSDVTSIHLGIARFGGFVSFHGPMAAAHANLSDVAKLQFWQMLEDPGIRGELHGDMHAVTTIVGGRAEGRLAGGCLSLLAASCGSRYAPDFDGKIVLIEDVGEAVYSADRNLWQLRNAGHFSGAAGFVIGSLTNWQSKESDPPLNTPDMLFGDFFGSLGKPAICGFPFGHEPSPLTLPLGVRACLDADEKSLTLVEPALLG